MGAVIYYFSYGTLLLLTFVKRCDKLTHLLIYWTVLIALFLFVGTRFEVGCDFSTYQLHYSLGAQKYYSEALALRDPGHWLLIRVLNDYNFGPFSLNVVASGVFFLGIHVMARKQPNPLAFLVLCFPILIINMPMAATRQSMAIGFMCLAFAAFADRRLILYILWIMIGFLFHSSILIFILIAPFAGGILNRRRMLVSALLAVPGVLALLSSDSASLAQGRYINSGVEAAGSAFRLGLLFLTGLLFFSKLAPAWRRQFPGDYSLAVVGGFFMVGFLSMYFISTVIGDRFGYYLVPLQAMIIARIPYLNLGKSKNTLTIAPYAVLSFVFVVWMQLSWHFQKCYLPYQSWIFGVPGGS
ncbi:EpsG family protein [Tateyamaria sp.]|uniref:EpsG family protein n=1 Tax=Tateyamaria sp. TaxID=1929288 RepID=UPI00329BA774